MVTNTMAPRGGRRLLAAFLFAAILSADAGASDWDARITAVTGEAYVYPEGEEDGVPAEKDMPLEEGDRIETGKGSRVEFALDPESVLDIGPNSTFTIDEPEAEQGWFTLALGSLVAKVEKFHLRRVRLGIRTPTAVAAVRGTEFGLEVDDDGDTTVGVVDEGELAVRPREDEEVAETVLKAREQTFVGHGKGFETQTREGKRFLILSKFDMGRKHVNRMKELRGRRSELRESWKGMSPEARGEARGGMRRMISGMSGKRANSIREFRQNRSDKLSERRGHLRRWGGQQKNLQQRMEQRRGERGRKREGGERGQDKGKGGRGGRDGGRDGGRGLAPGGRPGGSKDAPGGRGRQGGPGRRGGGGRRR